MRHALAAALSAFCVFFLSLRVHGTEVGAAASPSGMATEVIPADTAIVNVQAPKGTRVYSDTHLKDYGETTSFLFRGLTAGTTFQTQFTVTFPSQKKASRLFYLAGGQQFTLVFQETQESRPTLALQRGVKKLKDVTFSKDGQFLISFSHEGDIRLWSAETGRLLRSFHLPIGKHHLYFSRKFIHADINTDRNEIIADAHCLGFERFRWNYKSGVELPTLTGTRTRRDLEDFHLLLDYAPAFGKAIFRSENGNVGLFDTMTGDRIAELATQKDGQSGDSFFFCGSELKYAAVMDREAGELRLHSASTGTQVRDIQLPRRKDNESNMIGPFFYVDEAGSALYYSGGAFAARGKNQAAAYCFVVDCETGKVTTVLEQQVREISEDNELLNEKELWMYARCHTKTGKLAVGRHLLTWPELRVATSFEAPNGFMPCSFSGDGMRVVYKDRTIGTQDDRLLVFDTETGRQVCETAGGIDGVSGLLLASDKNEVWVANESRSKLQKFDLSTGRPTSPTISMDGVSGFMSNSAVPLSLPAMSAKNEIIWFENVYDRRSGEEVFSFHNQLRRSETDRRRGFGLFRSPYDSVVSGDGTLVAFAPTKRGDGDGGVAIEGYEGMTLWHATRRDLIREFASSRPLAFSPDSSALLCENEQIELLRVADGKPIARRVGPVLEIERHGGNICFSKDGKRIVLAGSAIKMRNGAFAQTEAEADSELQPLENAVGPVAALFAALRPRIEIWDGALQKRLRTLEPEGEVLATAFSPDSRLLAYSVSNVIVVLSEQGHVLRTFSTHSGSVGQLVWNTDSRRLLSSSSDGTIGLWDVGTGDELARLIPFDPPERRGDRDIEFAPDPNFPPAPKARFERPAIPEGETRVHFTSAFQPAPSPSSASGEDAPRPRLPRGGGPPSLVNTNYEAELTRDFERDWLVVTPEGLFDGTLGGRERVSFRVGDGLDVVPVDRFFQDFYYPGLWAKLWRGERPMPRAKFAESQPPKVTLVSKIKTEKVETRTVGIVVDVIDQGGGFKTPWLRHNEVVVAATLPPETRPGGIRQLFEVTLVEGENRLEVVSSSADGSRESEPASLRLIFETPTESPAIHVVAVGINQYAAGLKLNYAVQDAKAIADLFKSRGPQIYSDVEVRMLSDAEATRESILKAIAGTKAAPQDVFVLILAGHGVTIGQRYYFLPSDFRDEPKTAFNEDVRKSGIPNDELIDQVNKVAALKRLVIYDTCQSGGALGMPWKRDAIGLKRAMGEFSRAGSWLIAAAAGTEAAHEHKDLEHGLLTYTLLAGAAAVKHGPFADRHHNEQPFMTVGGWFLFAQDAVPSLGKIYDVEQSIEFHGSKANFPVLPAVKTLPP